MSTAPAASELCSALMLCLGWPRCSWGRLSAAGCASWGTSAASTYSREHLEMLRTFRQQFPSLSKQFIFAEVPVTVGCFFSLDSTKYNHLCNTADQLSNLPSVVPLWQALWIYICISQCSPSSSLSSHPTVFPVGVVTTEEAGAAGKS